MVKNVKGGSGHKSQARKFVNQGAKSSNRATRFSQDEYEYYAQVTKTLGNGMCHVICKDGRTRLCHIRGKFRGRGMRDNMIRNGGWVLVGGRDFESERSEKDTKLEKCDLLEVYSDVDKDRLKTLGGFQEFIARDFMYSNNDKEGNTFEFTERIEEEEHEQIMQSATAPVTMSTSEEVDEDWLVDVDDI